MKKMRLYIGIFALLSTLLFTGCGSEAPKDVAMTFAKALSSADTKEAKKVSTEKVQKVIERLTGICNRSYYNELTNEVAKAYNEINSKKEGRTNLEAKMSELMNNPENKKDLTEMKKSLIEKYGDIKNLPREKQKSIMEETMEMFSNKYLKPMINKVFDELKIKSKHPNEVKEILTKFLMTESIGKRNIFTSKRNAILRIIKNGNFKNIKNATPECIAKYTDYGFIDTINFIETTNKAADRAVVRLELIDKKGKSNKVSVNVEKIKDEWKVSQLSLNMW